jgi:hypothetical protein
MWQFQLVDLETCWMTYSAMCFRLLIGLHLG